MTRRHNQIVRRYEDFQFSTGAAPCDTIGRYVYLFFNGEAPFSSILKTVLHALQLNSPQNRY